VFRISTPIGRHYLFQFLNTRPRYILNTVGDKVQPCFNPLVILKPFEIRFPIFIFELIIIIWIGVQFRTLPHGGTAASVADARGLLYRPRISNLSYSGRQAPLASTTRGSPLAARGGTMGGNGGQMMPGIRVCTQGSLTCHKSATWDR
jgi:hypothetical protein